jgi:hypothetical protein
MLNAETTTAVDSYPYIIHGYELQSNKHIASRERFSKVSWIVKVETSDINISIPIEYTESFSSEFDESPFIEEHIVVKMPPKKRYTTEMVIKSIKRGKPIIVEPENLPAEIIELL